ncbi:SNARE-like domain protein [Dictyocaulus viviparus]|uniref:SNARE-like domain protein n=1 Tax=Dictyocaulus viviparus TaxID=29172 RepID=A0A0D8Y6K9_DICVI|nr:SNARE-like domain protein [Dictyocaulus viviparus]
MKHQMRTTLILVLYSTDGIPRLNVYYLHDVFRRPGSMLVTDRNRIFVLCGICIAYVFLLTLIYSNFPELEKEHWKDFKYPTNLEEAKKLGRVLLHYRDRHIFTIFFGVAVVYIMLQSFAIPGSIFLTILSGYLFNFFIAILLVCTCSAIGASICYIFSYLFGRDFVVRKFPERVRQWQADIARNQANLLSYIIFLRVTPFLPNWFINIASPVLDVPFFHFFIGTFIGVAPPSFLYIQAGSTLEQMVNTDMAWNSNSLLFLTLSALLSLVPVFWKRFKVKQL